MSKKHNHNEIPETEVQLSAEAEDVVALANDIVDEEAVKEDAVESQDTVESQVEAAEVEEDAEAPLVEEDTALDEPTLPIEQEEETVQEDLAEVVNEEIVEEAVEEAEEPVEEAEETAEESEEAAPEKTPEEIEAEKARQEEEERARQEAAEKKAAKKAKRKEWVKKHVALIVILCVVVLLGAGLATGHFVTTRNVAFIHKVEDLEKAVAEGKKTEYIFKSDIIYSGDLTLDNVKLDMNKHTLEVKGNLTFTGDGFVGYKKIFWSKPVAGGAVIVEGVYAQAGNVSWYSHLNAVSADVTGDLAICDNFDSNDINVTGSLNVSGEQVNSAANVTVGGDLTASGKINGNVTLAGNAEVSGYVKSITGGQTVKVQGTVETVNGAEKLYLYPDSNVQRFTAGAYYFVQYLEAPTVVAKKVDGTQVLLISHVLNADGYIIKVEGTEAEYDVRKGKGENTAYSMPDLNPGNYKVRVYPYSDTPEVYLGGANTQIKLSYYVQLTTPQVEVCEEAAEDGEHVVVRIQKVQNASNYVIHVGGKDYTVKAEDGVTTYDITSLISGTGSYDVYVYAKPPKKGNYEKSETTLVTYVRSAAATVSVVAYRQDEQICVSIAGNNAYYYLVEWKKGEDVVESVVIKAKAEGIEAFTAQSDVDAVTVTPLAKGYYTTGAAVTTTEILAAKPVANEGGQE